MPRYDAPIRDMRFILQEVLQIQNYSNLPGFEEDDVSTYAIAKLKIIVSDMLMLD